MRRKNNTHRTEHIYITVDSVTNQCVPVGGINLS